MLAVGAWSGVLGRGCDEAEISAEMRLFTERGQGIQGMSFGEELLRRGSSAKRFRPFSESLDPENRFFCAHPLPKPRILNTPIWGTPKLPKGSFRTENTTAMEK